MRYIGRTLAALLAAIVLSASVAAYSPIASGPQQTGTDANGVPCEDYIDVIRFTKGSAQVLVNERQPLDGYSLYSSKFFPSDAAAMDYVRSVQTEFTTCDWYEDADVTHLP
ncbi:MAG TPA: hypothetical protein VIG47_01195 [Gemmatimonadaceae bacterium]|jgi:hypothetical protein